MSIPLVSDRPSGRGPAPPDDRLHGALRGAPDRRLEPGDDPGRMDIPGAAARHRGLTGLPEAEQKN